ncbi:hypothetical protein F4779DRAFT_361837 [Xylariaceae sp. FL0662B]|nr:hypothetical protein F4779DRAFT_361837 [Xylariaceae sp. FL0662B]
MSNRSISPVSSGSYERAHIYHNPTEVEMGFHECPLRENLVDNCARSRLVAMIVEYFFLSGRASPDEPRECPMIRCRRQFEDARCMIQHVKICDRFKEGELWCPCCHTCQRFNTIDRTQCSWRRETLSRKLENGVRRISNTIQRKCSGNKHPEDTRQFLNVAPSSLSVNKITNQNTAPIERHKLHSELADTQLMNELPGSFTAQELPSDSALPNELSLRHEGASPFPSSRIIHHASPAVAHSTTQERRALPITNLSGFDNAQKPSPIMSVTTHRTAVSSPLVQSHGAEAVANNTMADHNTQYPDFGNNAYQIEQSGIQLSHPQEPSILSTMQDFEMDDWSFVRGNLAPANSGEPQYDRYLTKSPSLMDQDSFGEREIYGHSLNTQNDLIRVAHKSGAPLQSQSKSSYPCEMLGLDTNHASDLASGLPVAAFPSAQIMLHSNAAIPSSRQHSQCSDSTLVDSQLDMAEAGTRIFDPGHSLDAVKNYPVSSVFTETARTENSPLKSLRSNSGDCAHCDYSATTKKGDNPAALAANLKKHEKRSHAVRKPRRWYCNQCDKHYGRRDNLLKHQRKKHGGLTRWQSTSREGGETEVQALSYSNADCHMSIGWPIPISYGQLEI